MITLLLFVVIVAFNQICIANLQSSTSDYIDPSKLLVVTILDTTNNEVIRDGMTLLRSIRLFGGSLSNATIMVTIVYDGIWQDQDVFIQELIKLRVEIIFTNQSNESGPKTLNKFKSFDSFDSIRFDYMLWLDADIVVFNDPFPYFKRHIQPGEIYCVPDLYR